MGRIRHRLERAEGRVRPSLAEGGREVRTSQEFLSSLTDEELAWVAEPGKEAARLVPCPQHGGECLCVTDERNNHGFEARPDLRDEFQRRFQHLKERKGVSAV